MSIDTGMRKKRKIASVQLSFFGSALSNYCFTQTFNDMMTLSEKRTFLRNAGVQVANNANEVTVNRLASENGVTFPTNNTANSTANSNNISELQKFVEEIGGEFFAADSTTAHDAINEAKLKEYPDFGRDIPSGEYQIHNQISIKTHKRSDGRISRIWVCVVSSGNDYYLLQLASLRNGDYPIAMEDGTLIDFTPCVSVRRGESTTTKNSKTLAFIANEPKIEIHHAFGHNVNPTNEKTWNRILTWATEK